MIVVEPHVDETGQPCSRHAAVSSETLLAYAAIGSRVSGFHHDTASKLQSLMMAIDEIGELGDAAIQSAATTAATAVRELHQLLTVNRALAKAPQRKRTALRELAARAAERHGVKLAGELPAVEVQLAIPSIAHALAMLLDLAAGPLQQARTVAVTVTAPERRVRMQLTAQSAFAVNPNANEMIALAAFLLRREDASLSCLPDGFVVDLPAGD